MSKAQPLLAVNPTGSLAENAPQILYTRFSEMFVFARQIQDPMKVLELHKMRIAAKRLRYTLEIFSRAYSHAPEQYAFLIESIKQIQEKIGDIHDCDVRILRVSDYLNQHIAKKPEIRSGLQGLIDREHSLRDSLYSAFIDHWTALSDNNKFERDFVHVVFSVRVGSNER